jgi:hypothetical protein
MSDQDIENKVRALMSKTAVDLPAYAALLRQIDAERARAADLQVKLDAAIDALRPFMLERSKLSTGPGELVCTEDASHLIRAAEIVQRHDKSKKGGE